VRFRAELHAKTCEKFRGRNNIASQLVVEATSYAWSVRKTVHKGIRKCVLRFDSRLFSFKIRSGKIQSSASGSAVKRAGLPISQDGAYKRLQEHLNDGWKITSITMKRNLSFLAVLSKDSPYIPHRKDLLGNEKQGRGSQGRGQT